LLVGVFQNQPLAFILHAVASTQLDMVQLHGSEPVEWARHIPVPVIKVFHVDAEGNGLEGITRPGLHEFVLLDSVRPGDRLSGGNGKAVDWDLAASIVAAGEIPSGKVSQGKEEMDSANGIRPVTDEVMPIMLAGGLRPENVKEAVDKVHCWAVDVSGGVETADRRGKDAKKMLAFVRAAKGS